MRPDPDERSRASFWRLRLVIAAFGAARTADAQEYPTIVQRCDACGPDHLSRRFPPMPAIEEPLPTQPISRSKPPACARTPPGRVYVRFAVQVHPPRAAMHSG